MTATADEKTSERLLSVEGLETVFRHRGRAVHAINGVDFAVERGEIVALVGESGSGKSVTALSIMGLIPPRSGRIVAGRIDFDGRDLTALSDAELRDIRGGQIAMIFQEPMTSLNPSLTVGRQITESLELHLGLTPRQATARAIELLKQVGISDPERRVRAYPHQLSGGMRQRVMIAIAISCGPRLLIADEPTTALDVTTQAQILDLIDRLRVEIGSSVILITHDVGVVARYAQRVYVMYAGRIVERAPVGELFGRPRHPYTVGLLASVPRLDTARSEKLRTITGTPPNPLDLPQGCAFRTRCPNADDRCLAAPPLTTFGPGHEAACFHPVGEPALSAG